MKTKVFKSFKQELILNKDEKTFCMQNAGACRYIWNYFLNLKIEKWENNKEKLTRFDLDKKLSNLKKEKDWLYSSPSQSLQQVNKDLDQAFKNFFRGFGYPKFKKKGVKDSFRIPQGIKIENQLSKKVGRVFLPKIGIVKFIKTREIEGKIKYVTISKNCDKWFISFTCELEIDIEENYQNPIGIDRGVAVFAVCSDKRKVKSISPLKKDLTKLKKIQRKFRKKKRFSSNWIKIRQKLQKAHCHIANKRKDYLHKITTQLAKNHGLIFLEKLKVGNMSKSAKGSVENPGKNIKAKSGLNRSILDQGWHIFQNLLEYKVKNKGGKVIYINPKNTSIKCYKCHHIAKDNRKSRSKFNCVNCDFEADADYNASLNILAEGLSVIACGMETLVSMMNQELITRNPEEILV